jgi:hypothetical protein
MRTLQAAAALQPALGRSVSALLLAALALVALRRKSPLPASEQQPAARWALAFAVGALVAAAACSVRIRLGQAAGEDFLTTPLLIAAALGAAAIGARIRAPWPVGVAALALAALLAPWSFASLPEYLAGFDGYPAVSSLGARATVRLAAAIWAAGPLAVAAGMLVRAAGAPRAALLAGALAATASLGLPAGHAPLSREEWSRAQKPVTLALPLDGLGPGELRAYLATAAAAVPELMVTLDGDEAHLCAGACPAPAGPHLGRAEIDRLLHAGPSDPADAVATDDNLLLAEALAPLRHAGASRAQALALLRSFAAP